MKASALCKFLAFEGGVLGSYRRYTRMQKKYEGFRVFKGLPFRRVSLYSGFDLFESVAVGRLLVEISM